MPGRGWGEGGTGGGGMGAAQFGVCPLDQPARTAGPPSPGHSQTRRGQRCRKRAQGGGWGEALAHGQRAGRREGIPARLGHARVRGQFLALPATPPAAEPAGQAYRQPHARDKLGAQGPGTRRIPARSASGTRDGERVQSCSTPARFFGRARRGWAGLAAGVRSKTAHPGASSAWLGAPRPWPCAS